MATINTAYFYNSYKLPQKEKKTKAILDKARKNFFMVGQLFEWYHVGGRVEEKLRMSRASFFNLVSLLRPYIECQVTHMRRPVCPETQVALTLYYLSDEGRLRKVANAFGLSRPCCSIIIRRVSSAITLHLGPIYIKLPGKCKGKGIKVLQCIFSSTMFRRH